MKSNTHAEPPNERTTATTCWHWKPR